MVENLENRGCQLLGIHNCPTLEAQKARLSELITGKGRHVVHLEALTMNKIYQQKLNDEGEKARIERLEMLDEFEEWELLQSHYCITVAVGSSIEGDETQLRI